MIVPSLSSAAIIISLPIRRLLLIFHLSRGIPISLSLCMPSHRALLAGVIGIWLSWRRRAHKVAAYSRRLRTSWSLRERKRNSPFDRKIFREFYFFAFVFAFAEFFVCSSAGINSSVFFGPGLRCARAMGEIIWMHGRLNNGAPRCIVSRRVLWPRRGGSTVNWWLGRFLYFSDRVLVCLQGARGRKMRGERDRRD